ncbi:MAG: MBL fold metallo-hydrolase [Candidatus Sungiibacteriota bacterium]
MKLSFHGGAREVTGACHLLETSGAKILIDCGLFQGSRECEDANFEPFGFQPAQIDAVIITHAHIDHIGRLPKLAREGFRGIIFSTAATRDLAAALLEDALHIAERAVSKGDSRHDGRGSDALYSAEDLRLTMAHWRGAPYHEAHTVKDIVFTLNNAGHILGSAMVEVRAEEKRLLFTGDLGNVPSVLLPPPDVVSGIEYLIMESAYGTRTHEAPEERTLRLERAVEDAAARRGTLLIPAFATERTQEILFLLNEMAHQKRIPEMPLFVDSPLAIRITEVYERYPLAYKEEIRTLLRAHPNLFRSKKLRFTPSVDESKAINDIPAPKVIIAGSGMMAGGRILHHARRYLSDPASILLITGYQAARSLGRKLIEGEKTIRIMGEEIAVRAEVRKINGFSAHADNPQLFAFAEAQRDTLKRVFTVQGEDVQAEGLAQQIADRLGVSAIAPMQGQSFEI